MTRAIDPSLSAQIEEILGLLKAPKAQDVAWPKLAAEVLELYQPPVAHATLVKMRQVLREFGDAEVTGVRSTADLGPPAVARWVAWQTEQGRNPNTVKGLLSYLRAVCHYAADAGYLERVPFNRRRRYVMACPARKVAHSLEQVADVLESLERASRVFWRDHRLYALFAVYAYTGVRKNEALYLHTEDVDFGTRSLSIDPKRRRPKTERSASPVPMPGELVPILKRWLKACGSEWVFPRLDRTRPWSGGAPGEKPLDQVKEAGACVGVDGLTIESLRHTWATHAESAWGLTGPLIQRVLRHTNERTQERYRKPQLVNLAKAVAHISFGAKKRRARG